MAIELLIVFLLAILIDFIIGELPSTVHPVVFMGKLIDMIKTKFLTKSKNENRILGILMTFFLILFFVFIFLLLLYCSKFNEFLFIILASILLSTTFAIKSLLTSVQTVFTGLNQDIYQGRISVSFLVSRNTENLSVSEVVSAAIETLTENITDSVIAPLTYIFFFSFLAVNFGIMTSISSVFNIFSPNQFPIVIAVITGVSYRIINTLDAMVGYKDDENIDIGWFPAKTDDCINYIPARITGFLIVISSFFIRYDYKRSWNVMLQDAHNTPSPNSGYPMAATAGSLNVQLSKPGIYTLGKENDSLKPEKIIEALKLTIATIALFLIITLISMGLFI